VADLFAYAFSPAGIAWLLAGGALWLWLRPGSRLAPRLLLTVAVLYLAFSIFAVSFQFERLLVWGYQPLRPADVPAGRRVIVVLGSGSFTTRSWDGGKLTSVDLGAAERVLEAARVYRLVGADAVISSGGSPRRDDPDEPTGLAMRTALIDLGIPESRIRVETDSRNTHDEALIVAGMLKTLGAEQTILVTAARHMRRSVGTFKAAGVEVIPAIARNSFVDKPWTERWLPRDVGLWETREVAHEYLGLVAYLARGWYRR
jgi:uncharacterized SAM-binding protein YcdF (DUF218 family)